MVQSQSLHRTGHALVRCAGALIRTEARAHRDTGTPPVRGRLGPRVAGPIVSHRARAVRS